VLTCFVLVCFVQGPTGATELVSQGLRTLELCIDNLQPGVMTQS
jgi:hypothetical protein